MFVTIDTADYSKFSSTKYFPLDISLLFLYTIGIEKGVAWRRFWRGAFRHHDYGKHNPVRTVKSETFRFSGIRL